MCTPRLVGPMYVPRLGFTSGFTSIFGVWLGGSVDSSFIGQRFSRQVSVWMCFCDNASWFAPLTVSLMVGLPFCVFQQVAPDDLQLVLDVFADRVSFYSGGGANLF